jgi:hypothetical protein
VIEGETPELEENGGMETHVPLLDEEVEALRRQAEKARDRLAGIDPPPWETVARLLDELDRRGRLFLRSYELHAEAVALVRDLLERLEALTSFASSAVDAMWAIHRGEHSLVEPLLAKARADLLILAAAPGSGDGNFPRGPN